MRKSDVIPPILIAVDVDDPIVQSDDFRGLVEHGDMFEADTFDTDAEFLRAQKTDLTLCAEVDHRLRGCYLFKLFDECFYAFFLRVMGNPLIGHSLTAIGYGIPIGEEDESLEDDDPPPFTELVTMFKLSTVGELPDWEDEIDEEADALMNMPSPSNRLQ